MPNRGSGSFHTLGVDADVFYLAISVPRKQEDDLKNGPTAHALRSGSMARNQNVNLAKPLHFNIAKYPPERTFVCNPKLPKPFA
jgi:hypothetical protein